MALFVLFTETFQSITPNGATKIHNIFNITKRKKINSTLFLVNKYKEHIPKTGEQR